MKKGAVANRDVWSGDRVFHSHTHPPIARAQSPADCDAYARNYAWHSSAVTSQREPSRLASIHRREKKLPSLTHSAKNGLNILHGTKAKPALLAVLPVGELLLLRYT